MSQAARKEKPGGEADPSAKLLAKLVSDPEAQKTAHEHRLQKAERLYSPLFKQMALTADEAEKFKDLIAENEKQLAEKMLPFIGGDSPNHEEALINALAEEQKQGDERVKELLGEDLFAHYRDYRQTVGDRDGLHLFELDSPANALNDQQREQLLAIMNEEEQKVFASTSIPVSAMHTTDAEVEDYGRWQAALAHKPNDYSEQMDDRAMEMLNQQIFERARAILTPEQLASFGAYQSNKLEAMKKP